MFSNESYSWQHQIKEQERRKAETEARREAQEAVRRKEVFHIVKDLANTAAEAAETMGVPPEVVGKAATEAAVMAQEILYAAIGADNDKWDIIIEQAKARAESSAKAVVDNWLGSVTSDVKWRLAPVVYMTSMRAAMAEGEEAVEAWARARTATARAAGAGTRAAAEWAGVERTAAVLEARRRAAAEVMYESYDQTHAAAAAAAAGANKTATRVVEEMAELAAARRMRDDWVDPYENGAVVGNDWVATWPGATDKDAAVERAREAREEVARVVEARAAAREAATRVVEARAAATEKRARMVRRMRRAFTIKSNAVAPTEFGMAQTEFGSHLGGGRKRRLQNNTSKTYRKKKSKTYRKKKSKTYRKRKSKTYRKRKSKTYKKY